MKPFILVADGLDKNVFENLQKKENFDVHPEAKVDQDKLKVLLPKVQGLVIRSATNVTAELLEMAPELKLVIRAGEGTDNIDKKACAEKDVKVANTPGANNNSAAEHAIALMMSVLRHTNNADKSMKEGRWDKSLYTGMELTHKKVGIVGFGRIGQIVAKRLAGFEPDVTYYDPFCEQTDIPYATRCEDLKKLFSECDIITLHTPLMPETKGIVNAELLGSMKKSAILVNASRGGIVDEDALLNILKEEKIAGAGFDVFATEPLEDSSPLRKLDNLLLTPHLGASTKEAQSRVGEMVLNQLDEFFNKKNLLNEVKA